MRDKSTIGGPRRAASRDLVRLACPSCDDEVRVPADEVRPKCQRCDCLVIEPSRRANDFAIEEMTVLRNGEPIKRLVPAPGGYVEIPIVFRPRRPRGPSCAERTRADQ